MGGGGGGINFQLLMPSSNLLKSKIPISGGGGGVWWNQLSMPSSNLLKSKIPISGGGGGVAGTNFQLLMLSSNLLKKNFFAKNFLSFRTKSIYRRTTKIKSKKEY